MKLIHIIVLFTQASVTFPVVIGQNILNYHVNKDVSSQGVYKCEKSEDKEGEAGGYQCIIDILDISSATKERSDSVTDLGYFGCLSEEEGKYSCVITQKNLLAIAELPPYLGLFYCDSLESSTHLGYNCLVAVGKKGEEITHKQLGKREGNVPEYVGVFWCTDKIANNYICNLKIGNIDDKLFAESFLLGN